MTLGTIVMWPGSKSARYKLKICFFYKPQMAKWTVEGKTLFCCSVSDFVSVIFYIYSDHILSHQTLPSLQDAFYPFFLFTGIIPLYIMFPITSLFFFPMPPHFLFCSCFPLLSLSGLLLTLFIAHTLFLTFNILLLLFLTSPFHSLLHSLFLAHLSLNTFIPTFLYNIPLLPHPPSLWHSLPLSHLLLSSFHPSITLLSLLKHSHIHS